MNATLNKKREEPQKLKQGGENREKEESDRWISDEKSHDRDGGSNFDVG
jgi:hypothetical protein